MLTVRAYAKINLTLEALGKRADGYHSIVSVMQTIDLSDRLSLAPSDEITLRCSEPSLETDDNLAARAAALLKERAGYGGGVDISLEKAIPLASGLGGGSSDAAATLKALCRLWKQDLGYAALQPLAASLGSDVPFFLSGGTAMAEGRGEEIHRLPQMPRTHLAILAPREDFPNKTASMYGRLTQESYTGGERSARLRDILLQGKKAEPDMLFNVFEDVAFRLLPSLETCRRAMLDAGADWVRLAGSGPAMYTFAASGEEAAALAGRLRDAGYAAYAAVTTGPSDWP